MRYYLFINASEYIVVRKIFSIINFLVPQTTTPTTSNHTPTTSNHTYHKQPHLPQATTHLPQATTHLPQATTRLPQATTPTTSRTYVSSILFLNWSNSAAESLPSLLWSNIFTKCRALSSGYLSSVFRMPTACSNEIKSSPLKMNIFLFEYSSSIESLIENSSLIESLIENSSLIESLIENSSLIESLIENSSLIESLIESLHRDFWLKNSIEGRGEFRGRNNPSLSAKVDCLIDWCRNNDWRLLIEEMIESDKGIKILKELFMDFGMEFMWGLNYS